MKKGRRWRGIMIGQMNKRDSKGILEKVRKEMKVRKIT
jgi:hypothetical protein